MKRDFRPKPVSHHTFTVVHFKVTQGIKIGLFGLHLGHPICRTPFRVSPLLVFSPREFRHVLGRFQCLISDSMYTRLV